MTVKAATIVQTDRLLIREFIDDDLEPLAEILADPDVMHYSVNGVMTRESTSKFIKSCIEQYKKYGYSSWAVEKLVDKQFIGFVGLAVSDTKKNPKEVDIPLLV